MPKYRVQDSESGKTLLLEGDSPPTDAELQEIFKPYQEEKQPTSKSDYLNAPKPEPAVSPEQAAETAIKTALDVTNAIRSVSENPAVLLASEMGKQQNRSAKRQEFSKEKTKLQIENAWQTAATEFPDRLAAYAGMAADPIGSVINSARAWGKLLAGTVADVGEQIGPVTRIPQTVMDVVSGAPRQVVQSRNISAALAGEELPAMAEIAKQPGTKAALAGAILGTAKTLPMLVTGGVMSAAQPELAPLFFGTLFGLESYAETGDPQAAMRAAALGVVLPAAGHAGTELGAQIATKAGVQSNLGQKVVELIGNQTALQAVAHVANLPEYPNMTPDQRKRAALETTFSFLAFAGMEVGKFNPKIPSLVQQKPELLRQLAQKSVDSIERETDKIWNSPTAQTVRDELATIALSPESAQLFKKTGLKPSGGISVPLYENELQKLQQAKAPLTAEALKAQVSSEPTAPATFKVKPAGEKSILPAKTTEAGATTKGAENAIQEQSAESEVLGDQGIRGARELRGVGKENDLQQPAGTGEQKPETKTEEIKTPSFQPPQDRSFSIVKAAEKSKEGLTEAFQKSREVRKQWESDIAQWEQSLPKNERLIFKDNDREFYQVILPDPEGGYRIAKFTQMYRDEPNSIAPWGHERFKTRLEAVTELARRGDVTRVEKLPSILSEQELKALSSRKNAEAEAAEKQKVTDETKTKAEGAPSAAQQPAVESVRTGGGTEVAATAGLKESQNADLKSRISSITDDQIGVTISKLTDNPATQFVQLDVMQEGKERVSSNPTDMREMGYDMPTKEELLKLPQGNYTLTQAKEMLKKQAESVAKSLGEMTPDEAIRSGADKNEYNQAVSQAFRDEKISEKEFTDRSRSSYPDVEWTKAKIGEVIWDDYNRSVATVKDVSFGKTEDGTPRVEITVERNGQKYKLTPFYVKNAREFAESRIKANRDLPSELAKQFPDLVKQSEPSPVAAESPKQIDISVLTKAELVEELIGKKPDKNNFNYERRVEWELRKKQMMKFKADELRNKVVRQRADNEKQAAIKTATDALIPEIQKVADDAKGSWKVALKKRAESEGASFNPPATITKGEAVYTVSNAIAYARNRGAKPKAEPSKFGIEILEDGAWRELALEDVNLKTEAEAQALADNYAQSTGNKYRVKGIYELKKGGEQNAQEKERQPEGLQVTETAGEAAAQTQSPAAETANLDRVAIVREQVRAKLGDELYNDASSIIAAIVTLKPEEVARAVEMAPNLKATPAWILDQAVEFNMLTEEQAKPLYEAISKVEEKRYTEKVSNRTPEEIERAARRLYEAGGFSSMDAARKEAKRRTEEAKSKLPSVASPAAETKTSISTQKYFDILLDGKATEAERLEALQQVTNANAEDLVPGRLNDSFIAVMQSLAPEMKRLAEKGISPNEQVEYNGKTWTLDSFGVMRDGYTLRAKLTSPDTEPKFVAAREVKPLVKTEEVKPAVEKVTDPAQIQEIKNSIAEGEMILKSGKTSLGRKMSPEELALVQRSVDASKARLPEETAAPKERYKIITMGEGEAQILDTQFPGGQSVVKTFASKNALDEARQWIREQEEPTLPIESTVAPEVSPIEKAVQEAVRVYGSEEAALPKVTEQLGKAKELDLTDEQVTNLKNLEQELQIRTETRRAEKEIKRQGTAAIGDVSVRVVPNGGGYGVETTVKGDRRLPVEEPMSMEEAQKLAMDQLKNPRPPEQRTQLTTGITPELENKYLRVEVGDITEAEQAAKFADRQTNELRNQWLELDVQKQKLKPKIMTTRRQGGYGYGRGKTERIKTSAKQADVNEYQRLEREQYKLDTQIRAIEDASRKDRQTTEKSRTQRIVNDPTAPLIERLGARDRLYEGKSPAEFTKLFESEANVEMRRKHPDITPEEMDKMRPQLMQEARVGRVQSGWQLNPALQLDLIRQREVMDAYRKLSEAGAMGEELPAELKAELDQIAPEWKWKLDNYSRPKKLLSAMDVARLKSEMQKGQEAILAAREKAAAEAKTKAEEEAREIAAAEAEARQMMDEAQAMVSKAGKTTATAIKNEFIKRIQLAIDAAPEELGTKKRAVIGVPGDGVFLVENTKKSLQQLLAKAKSIATNKTQSWTSAYSKVREPNPPKIGSAKNDAEVTKDLKEHFASKDENRPGIEGVYSDGKRKIATNGRLAIEVTQEGKENSPEGYPLKEVEGFLDRGNKAATQEVYTEDLWRAAGHASVMNWEGRDVSPKMDLWIGPKGEIFMETTDVDKNYASYGIKVDGAKKLITINPEYLSSLVETARKLGNDTIKIGTGIDKVGIEYIGLSGKNLRAILAGLADPAKVAERKAAGGKQLGKEEVPTAPDNRSVQDVWKEQLERELEKVSVKNGDTGLSAAAESVRTAEMLEMPKADIKQRLLDRGMSEENADYALKSYKEPVEPEKKIIGMGGAVNEEFIAPEKIKTATKMAAIDRDRIERGQSPMMDAITKADPVLAAQAINAIDNYSGNYGSLADELIARHQTNPFLPTDVQHVVLLIRRVELKNEANKLNREIILSEQEGRFDAADAARGALSAITNQIDILDSVTGKGDTAQGTMLGRAFRARQLVMNEDFSMDELVPDMQSRYGRALNKDEYAKLQQISDENARKVAEYEQLLEGYERNRSAEQDKAIFEEAKRASELMAKSERPSVSQRVIDLAEEIVSRWERRAELAERRLADRLGRMSAGIDPTIVIDLAEVMLAKIGRKALTQAEFILEMVSKFGEQVRPYGEAVWNKTNELFEAERQGQDQGVRAVEAVRRSTTGASTRNVIDSAREGIQRNLERNTSIKTFLNRLGRYFIEQGERDPSNLVRRLYEVVQTVDPEMTIQEVRDAYSGYGELRNLPMDEVSIIQRDSKRQLQQIAKLEAMASGEAPLRTGLVRDEPSAELRQLTQQVEAAKRKGGYVSTDPATQLKTALDEAKTRLRNQIIDLDTQIKNRQKIVKERYKVQADAELEALRKQRDLKKQEYDEVFAPPALTDAERLQLWKENAIEKQRILSERIKNKDFAPRKRPDPVRLDREAIKINYELNKLHRVLLEMRQKADESKWSTSKKLQENALNSIRFSRAVITGADFSAVLRQGGFIAFSHPIIASKSIWPMLKAFWREKNQFAVMEDILTRENAPRYKRDNLELTETGMKLSTMEEYQMFRVAESLKNAPGLAELGALLKSGQTKAAVKGAALYPARTVVHVTEAFQRAYTLYLNKLRADTYDYLANIYGNDPATGKDIANLINVSTGRGSHDLGKKMGPAMNTIFFAPRFSMSRIQLLTLQPWRIATNKKMIMKEYLRAAIGASIVYSLGMAAGGSINLTDPSSSDWMKIRLGNHLIDPASGLIQPAVLISKFINGMKTLRSGRQIQLTGEKKKYGESDLVDELLYYAWGKGNPFITSWVHWRQGHSPYSRDPYTTQSYLRDIASPITSRDMIKAFDEEGIDGVTRDTVLALLAALGMGVSTQD